MYYNPSNQRFNGVQNIGGTMRIAATIEHLDYKSKSERPWLIDGQTFPHNYSYEKTFKPLLDLDGVETFNDLFAERKKTGTTHILDLFGSGIFCTDSAVIDSLLGVRKNDERFFEEPSLDKKTLLYSNLYSGKAWKEIVGYMKQEEIKHFDVIVCRGAGVNIHSYGKNCFKDNRKNQTVNPRSYLDLYCILFNKSYDLLTQNDGMIFVQLPSIGLHDETLYKWVHHLNENGIESVLKQIRSNKPPVLRIVKSRRSPNKIPDFNEEVIFKEDMLIPLRL